MQELPVAPDDDLGALLASIEPTLQPGTYVFCRLDDGQAVAALSPLLLFSEPEGTTAVVTIEEATAHGIDGAFLCEWVVLGAESDLSAVGFLAEITRRLASAGIPVNVVSAFHHDHLFVPEGRGNETVALLGARQDHHRDEAGPGGSQTAM